MEAQDQGTAPPQLGSIGTQYQVIPIDGDPLIVRLEVLAGGSDEVSLPYDFCHGERWKLTDAAGTACPYTGNSKERVSPESMGNKGWIKIAPGHTYMVERVELHFDTDGRSAPFSYMLNGRSVPTKPVEIAAVQKVVSPHHCQFMRLAVAEAQKSIPSDKAYCVGCVIVPSGTAETLDAALMEGEMTADSQVLAANAVMATGYSRELPGNTHAEECALMKLQERGIETEGCDMYTSMEPCSKRLSGKDPCVSRCIKHRLGRVFVGVREPLHFVRCQGVAQLMSAGIHCFDVVYDGVRSDCLKPNLHIAKFAQAGSKGQQKSSHRSQETT